MISHCTNRMRFIPAAVSPIPFKVLFSSLYSSLTRNGISEFEQELARYFGKEVGVSFTSLMKTNYGCFQILKSQKAKTEVIVPRYVCPSFTHGVLAAGLRPLFVDVDPTTLSIDLNSLSKVNPQNAVGVVCPNLFGLSNPMPEILDYCQKHDLFVIEGVDYSIGSELNGRPIGTFGDIAILNFQEGKALPVGGGMLAFKNARLLNDFENEDRKRATGNFPLMLAYKIFSLPSMYFWFMTLTKLFRIQRKKFSMEDTIRNTYSETDFQLDETTATNRLSNFQGSLGSALLPLLNEHADIRRKNASKLETRLRGVPGITLISPDTRLNKIHYIRYPILVDAAIRPKLIERLLKNGIEASPMYIEHGMSIDASEYPGANRVLHGLMTPPCHPYVQEDDIEKMITIVRDECSRANAHSNLNDLRPVELRAIKFD